MDHRRVALQQFAGRIDDTRRGGVELGDLFQHQFLVGHGFRHGDGGPQSGNRGRAGAVHALQQLDIVLLDQIKRQITLHRNGQLRQQILRALPHIEQRIFADRLGLGRINDIKLGRALFQFLVEHLGHVDHLFQLAHRVPQLGALVLDADIVLQQLILAALQRAQDGVDVGLRALVTVEVRPQLVAAHRDEAKQLLAAGQLAGFAGIKILDDLAQLHQIGTDAGFLVQRARRPIEEAVGLGGGPRNFGRTQVGERIDLLAEFRAGGIGGDQLIDEAFHLGFQLGLFLILQRHQAGGFRRRNGAHRHRGFQLDRDFFRHACPRLLTRQPISSGVCLLLR